MAHSGEQAFPWQGSQWQQLQNIMEQKRLPHALLVSGPSGIGKLRLARAFAAQLICQQPVSSGACGSCDSCRLLDAESHPDFRFLQAAEGKKQIGVDQVRELIQFSQQTAYREGGRKVVLIEPAESMNTHTANALLKTLEEPSGDTVLLLISHSPSRLLPTIRSRCLQFTFPLPDLSAAQEWLTVLVQDSDISQQLLGEAGGRPLQALQLFENEGLTVIRECDALWGEVAGGQLSILDAAERLLEQDVDFVLGWWANRVSALVRKAVAGEQSGMLPDGWKPWLNWPATRMIEFQYRLLQVRAQFQRGVALNKRLVMEGLLIDWFVEAI